MFSLFELLEETTSFNTNRTRGAKAGTQNPEGSDPDFDLETQNEKDVDQLLRYGGSHGNLMRRNTISSPFPLADLKFTFKSVKKSMFPEGFEFFVNTYF